MTPRYALKFKIPGKEFAKAIVNAPPPPRSEPSNTRGEGLEHDAVMQMEKACLLPVAVAGALMSDARGVWPADWLRAGHRADVFFLWRLCYLLLVFSRH